MFPEVFTTFEAMEVPGKTLRDYPASLDSVDTSKLLPDQRLGAFIAPTTQFETPQDTSPRDTHQTFGNSSKPYKPFPFALRRDEDGFRVYKGSLISQVNRMQFDSSGRYVSQVGLAEPTVVEVTNIEVQADYETEAFDWSGAVYLYWETDSKGVVNLCEIRGPDEPDVQELPLTDGATKGKFFVKIGTVPANGEIVQDIGSDVYWHGAFIDNQSSSSSGSGGSGSSGASGGGSVSGSDKSTAIVPMPWHPKGYGALFTMESNEVLFEFVMRGIPILGRETIVRIDSRFLHVCEEGSIIVAGTPVGPEPYPVGASVSGNVLKLTAYARKDRRPSKVNLKLTGVRRGFHGFNMPERSQTQFEANEQFLNSAYPAE